MLEPEGLVPDPEDIKRLNQRFQEIKNTPHLYRPKIDHEVAVLYVNVIKKLWENPIVNKEIIDGLSLNLEQINDDVDSVHAIEPTFSHWVAKLPEDYKGPPPGGFAYCTLDQVTFENVPIYDDLNFFKYASLRNCSFTGNTIYECKNFETTIEWRGINHTAKPPTDLSVEEMVELYRDNFELACENRKLQSKIEELEIKLQTSSRAVSQLATKERPSDNEIMKAPQQTSQLTPPMAPTPAFMNQVKSLTPNLFASTSKKPRKEEPVQANANFSPAPSTGS